MVENIWKVMSKFLAITGILITAIISFIIAKGANSGFAGFITFIVTAFIIGIYMFIPCLLIYSVGELFANLRVSNENTHEICKLLERNLSNDKNSKMNLSKVVHEVNSEKGKLNLSQVARQFQGEEAAIWICSACSSKNNRGDIYCTGCGAHK